MAVTTVAFSDLDSWLQAQPDNTASTPYELEITGLTINDLDSVNTSGSLGYIIKENITKYVDLSSTTLPSGLTILNMTFGGCSNLIKPPVLPENLTRATNVFYWCTSLTDAPVIPSTVTRIDGMFYQCSSLVKTPVIPDGVEKIDSLFANCISLEYKSIIPSSATSILSCYDNVTATEWRGTKSQAEAFVDSTNPVAIAIDPDTLEVICTVVVFSNLNTWLGSQPANTQNTPYKLDVAGLTTSDIGSSGTSGKLGYVLNQNITKYIDLSYTQIPDGVTDMQNAFHGCTSLVNAPVIPDSVTDMSYTFSGCASLANAPVIPDEVWIMGYTFEGCTSLVNAPVIPDSVTSMEHTFKDCTSLINAPVISDNVSSMLYTFEGCTSLVNAPVIPDNVANINGTFWHCTSLINAPVIPDSVTNMSFAFDGCASLANAPVIPDGVTLMADTFRNCTSLAYKPIIPSTVTSSTNCYLNVSTPNWKGTQSQAESFLSTFFAQTTDSELQIYNNDRVTYKESICNVDFSTLSTYLARLDPNTASTAYKIYVRGLENVQTEEDVYAMRTAFHNNDTKYVDLSYTTVPNWYLYDGLFGDCFSLVIPPNFASDWRAMGYTFWGCTNLKEAPIIPSSVQYLRGTFAYCTSLETPAELPSGILGTEVCYAYSGVTTTGDLNKSSLENCAAMFAYCTNLTTVQNLPPNLEYMYDSSTELMYRKGMFEGCTSIESIPNVPSSVSDGRRAFKDCTSLKTIEEFGISASALDSTYFQDMFSGCTTLEQIGYKVNASPDWHVFALTFDGSSVKGTVYGKSNNQITAAAIAQTSITQSSIRMPVLTDELWFPTSSDNVDAVIRNMITYQYGVFNKQVVPPDDKYLILWADEDMQGNAKVITNFGGGGGGGGIDVDVVSASKTITPSNDKREIIDTASVVLTLGMGATNGTVVEAYAMADCSVTYYTDASTTSTLSMLSGTRAVFIYFNGWKYNGAYGAVWN